MPTYRITDPETGRKVRLTGDSPPTEEELEEIFAEMGKPAAKAGMGDLRVAEQAASPISRQPIPGIPGIGGEKLPQAGPPARPADIPAPAPPEDPTLGEMLLPKARGPKAKKQQPIRDADGNVTGYVPVEESGGFDGISDLASAATRTAGAAIPSAATRGKNPDGSTKSFKQAMADPETGLGRAAREHLGEVIAGRLGNLKKPERTALQKYIDLRVAELAAAGYLGAAILEDPTVLLTGIAKGAAKGLEAFVPRAKKLVEGTSKLPGESLERAAKDLPSVQAAAETQEGLATDIASEVSTIRRKNAARHQALEAEDEAAHTKAVADQDAAFEAETQAQKTRLGSSVAAERPAGAIPSPAAISPYESGKRLETAVAAARASIGEKFGKKLSEAFHQSGVSMQPLPKRALSGEAARAVTGSTKIVRQNPLEDFFDESLRRAGYDPAKGYQGNEEVSQGAVKWLLDRKGFAKNQRTLGQVLKFRKNFQDQLFKDSEGPSALFPRSGQGAADYRFLKAAYDESNRLIAELPARYLPDQEAAAFRDAWEEMNRSYSEVRQNLDDLAQGLGRASDPEDFMRKMKDIGVDNFKAFNEAAKKHPEMKAVVDEMRSMTFDNVLRLSLDPKDGNAFDPQRFVNLWNAEYRDGRELLVEALGGARVARINQAVARFQLPEKPAPIPKPEKLPGQEPAFPRLAGRQEVPEPKAILSTVSNIGNRPNVFALRELEFLDNVLGLQGKDRFTERALDAYAAKELGIGKGGVVPTRNLQRTGFATGSRVAGTTSGAAAGFLLGKLFGQEATGAAIGAVLGQEVGARITSPSTAIASFKAINRLEKVLVSKRAVSILKAATRTRDRETLLHLAAQLEREISASNVVPFRQVAGSDATKTEDRHAEGD